MVFKLYIIFEDPFISTYALDENGVLQRWSLWFKYLTEMQIHQKTNKGVQDAIVTSFWTPEKARLPTSGICGKAEAVGTLCFF